MSTNWKITCLIAILLPVCIFLAPGCSGKDGPVSPSMEAAAVAGANNTGIDQSDVFCQYGTPRGYAKPSADNQYLEGEVLVVLKDEAQAGISKSILTGWPLEPIQAIKCRWGTIFEMKITEGTSVPDMANRLKKDSRVLFAEPNYILHFQETPYWPNDPLWESDDSGDDPRDSVYDQWGPSKIGADIVWNELKGSEDVVVAVIDTGVRKDHEDLKDSLWNNEDEIPSNGTDDDENGWTDDTWGWDCWGNTNNPYDDGAYASYHGTACSGIIAAFQDNLRGLTGIAPHVKIMALKVDLTGSDAFVSTVCAAFEYARVNGADIASMSFGTGTYSDILETACNDTWDNGNGVILMASAGNYSTTDPLYPAYYDSVMAIGATVPFNASNQPIDEVRISYEAGYYWGSNYGDHLTVMGFGEKYMTTYGGHYDSYWDGGSQGFFSGTSCACPMTAAVMALIKSYFPEESQQWCESRIMDTADDLDAPGFDIQTGHGRANAFRAIYGSDRYSDLEDPDGFVQLNMQQDRVFDSIHDVTGNPYQDTEDPYKLTVKGDGLLNIDLDIFTWGENLDLRVYSDKEMTDLVDESVGENHAADSHESLSLDVHKNESYYIRVFSPSSGNSSTYGLTVHNVYDYISVQGENLSEPMVHHPLQNIPFLKLTFTTGTAATLSEVIITKSGTTPNLTWSGARLYIDSNDNGSLDFDDELIANKMVQVVNRIRFDFLDLELAYDDPLVLFFAADLGNGPDGGTIRFSLENYKDVSTVEGFMASYIEFPVQSALVTVGTDIDPPTWASTIGIQSAVPRWYAVDVGWNEAVDLITPPARYNVYYSDKLPFNFVTATKLSGVAFHEGETTDYEFTVPSLPSDVTLHFAVRAEDQA
jgi:subtilisin family serine protease